MSMSIFPCKVY